MVKYKAASDELSGPEPEKDAIKKVGDSAKALLDLSIEAKNKKTSGTLIPSVSPFDKKGRPKDSYEIGKLVFAEDELVVGSDPPFYFEIDEVKNSEFSTPSQQDSRKKSQGELHTKLDSKSERIAILTILPTIPEEPRTFDITFAKTPEFGVKRWEEQHYGNGFYLPTFKINGNSFSLFKEMKPAVQNQFLKQVDGYDLHLYFDQLSDAQKLSVLNRLEQEGKGKIGYEIKEMRLHRERYEKSKDCLFKSIKAQADIKNKGQFNGAENNFEVTEKFEILNKNGTLSLQGTLSITAKKTIVETSFKAIEKNLKKNLKYDIELSMTVEDDTGAVLKLVLNDNDKMNFEFKLDK